LTVEPESKRDGGVYAVRAANVALSVYWSWLSMFVMVYSGKTTVDNKNLSGEGLTRSAANNLPRLREQVLNR